MGKAETDSAKRYKLLFAPEVVDLAETHRMTSMALAAKEMGHEVIVVGEGRYEHLFADKGFERERVAFDTEWMTPERFRMMHDLDEYGLDFISVEDLETFVQQEVELLERLRPDAVITGFRPTLSVSCKIAKVPLVWVLSAVVSDPYFEGGFASTPYGVEAKSPVIRALPRSWRDAVARFVPLRLPVKIRHWNQVMRNHGLRPFSGLLKVLRGDLNLMSDAPELFPEMAEALPPYYAFTGPLLPEMHIDRPESLASYERKPGRPVVFFSMGSSGDPALYREILTAFEGKPYDVFAATTTILQPEDLPRIPDNVRVEKMFPAAEVTALADAVVIHGGQGTVYTTLMAGRPFVGIPMFSEQQYNLENAARHGCGVVLPRPGVTAEKILQALDQVLEDASYRKAAEGVAAKLAGYGQGGEKRPARIGVEAIERFLQAGAPSYFEAKGW